MDIGSVLVLLVGIAVIAVGVLILMGYGAQTKQVVVREDVVRPWGWRHWGPYYAHLPVRPLVY